ncbi:MAG: MotE family protein [Planctomycetota bacterium]|jgi:flagellar motility protein MotE (MotC chaperone)
MKKALIIGGIVVLAGALFLTSLVLVVRARGGVNESQGLASVPVIGGLVKAEPVAEPAPAEEVAQEPVPAAGGGEATFLRFGPQARLERLADELRLKKSDYDDGLQEVERRMRELDAWERQLKEERDKLRAAFAAEKEDLIKLKDDLARQKAEQDARQILIETTEEGNLKKTAEIYGKMEAEKAAEILTEMYQGDQPETVVKIIYLMQDRSAAKTLAAITNAEISAEITEKIKRIGQDVQQGG